jgi:short-subunit dehydrogenase
LRLAIFGATSAIAGETAKRFAADRAEIVLIGRDATRLEAVAADLRARGAPRVEVLTADLAVLDEHAGLVEKAWTALDGLDAVLIAHGTLGDQKASESDVSVMLAEMRTNALSYMSLLTLLGNRFEAQRAGCIAVISSVAGDRGRASNYVYGSAKAAVSAFTSGLRARLSKAGVSVVTVKPGVVDTPMTGGVRKGPLTASPDKVGARIYEAMLKGEDTVYTPWFWAPIMQVIRAMPERVFKKLKF